MFDARFPLSLPARGCFLADDITALSATTTLPDPSTPWYISVADPSNSCIARVNAFRSGRLYGEFGVKSGPDGTGYCLFGVVNKDFATSGVLLYGSAANGYGVSDATFSLATAGIIGIAVDTIKQAVWFHLNGTWALAGSPDTAPGGTAMTVPGPVTPAVGHNGFNAGITNVVKWRGLRHEFSYPVPTNCIPWGEV